jgi:N6-adenosine-specific RNA methylase IME4
LISQKTKDKQKLRRQREKALAKQVRALPNKKYCVISADPEWRFEPYSRITGMDRSADNHYVTSALSVIKSRNVVSIAARHCVLFLWATVPMLTQALEVMKAWGFKYKSHFIWFKDKLGTGYWNRNAHELLLVGTRGSIPAPAPGTQWPSVLKAPRGRHSEKPSTFYDMIEAYYPTLPRIELNARKARANWDRWGAEAPKKGAR